MSKLTFTRHFVDEEGYCCDEEVTIPAINQICPRCNAEGTHDHEAFSNGISMEEFAEDPDFAEAYFEGVYDVPCSVCHGNKVIQVPNPELCTPEQLQWWEEKKQQEREIRIERQNQEKYGF